MIQYYKGEQPYPVGDSRNDRKFTFAAPEDHLIPPAPVSLTAEQWEDIDRDRAELEDWLDHLGRTYDA